MFLLAALWDMPWFLLFCLCLSTDTIQQYLNVTDFMLCLLSSIVLCTYIFFHAEIHILLVYTDNCNHFLIWFIVLLSKLVQLTIVTLCFTYI